MTPEEQIQALLADEQSMAERMQAEGELIEGEAVEEAPTPMDERDIMGIVTTELEQARDAYTHVEAERERSLSAYLGLATPAQDDRSSIVSTDVADSLEWMLPQIMEQLTGKGPVVQFDSMGPQDDEQAELETDFTHYVFMQENDGFVNLYQFVKDALMQKNGIFKIFYDRKEETKYESYDGLTPPELQVLLSDPLVELVEATSTQVMDMASGQPVEISAVRVRRTCYRGELVVETVPPEEFYVNAGHPSVMPDSARFTCQVTQRTASDMIKEGHDPEKINNAPEYQVDFYKEYRFNAQGESAINNYAQSPDSSQKLIQVVEAYMQIDTNGDGVSELMKITCIGDRFTIVDILSVEPIAAIPFVAATPWIMPHKFFGLSVYDRVKEIQAGKTSLWRNTLDNIYLQNNREKEVVEKLVNLDDLLISRPGGIKRVKQAGAIRELEVQPVGNEAMGMMSYFDQVRAGRTGVAPDMAGQALPIGQDTAHGVERVMTASEALVGLVIRSIAETGLREAYKKIRDLLVRYQDSTTAFKFRDQWIDVNPSDWGERSRLSVTVGTGTGDDMRRQAALQKVLEYQTMIVQDPRNTLVDQQQIYNALDDLADAAGLDGAQAYFLNPASPQGQQKQQEYQAQQQEQTEQQMQVQQAMVEMQQKVANAEQARGMAEMQSAQARAQKAMGDLRIEQMQMRIDALQDASDREYDYSKLASETALKLTELEAQYQQDLSQQHRENVDEQ